MYRLLAGETGFGWSWRPVSASFAAAADPEDKVHLLLDWTGKRRDIADPWYTGNFEATFRDIWQGCNALLDALEKTSG